MREKILKFIAAFLKIGSILILFSIPFSSSLVNALIITCVILLFVSKIIKKEALFALDAVTILIIAYIAVSFVSFKNSPDIASSIKGILKILKGGGLYLVVMESFKDRMQFRRAGILVAIASSLVCLDGFFQFFKGYDFIRGFPIQVYFGGIRRITATFRNTNDLGIYLVCIVPLLIAMSFIYRDKIKRKTFEFVSLINLTAIALTFSRTAGLAFYCSMIPFTKLKNKKSMVLFLLMPVFIAAILLIKPIAHWINNPGETVSFWSYNSRLIMWQTSANMIKDHPVIGVGINTFTKNYKKYESATDRSDISYAHNMYLQMWAEIGTIGLLIFLVFCSVFLKECSNSYIILNRKQDDLRFFLLAVCAGFFGFLTSGMLESSFYYSKLVPFFWYYLGVGRAIKHLSNSTLNIGQK